MRLTINFKVDDLKEIYKNNQKVVLIKRQEPNECAVVWGTFQPWQRNIIEWDNHYAIYASNYIEKGTIYKLAEKSAAPGIEYNLVYGFFEESENQDKQKLYDAGYFIRNSMSGYNKVTVGLAQSICINGQVLEHNPINKFDLFPGCMVAMSYDDTIEVGLATETTNSMIYSGPLNASLILEYDKDKKDYNIAYDGETGKFV